MGKSGVKTLKEVLLITVICLIGLTAVIFSVLYVDKFSVGVIKEYSSVFLSVSVGIITVLTVLSVVFYKDKKEFVYKLFFITVILIASVLIILYILNATGFLDKIDSIEDFRNYIANFGSISIVIFIILQFAQVVILPIPAFITVGAGVLLFGPLNAAIYSLIGIISGSIVAFFIGKIFGYKVVKWLIGKENLDKGLKTIKGKDKIILTFMFLFPFFPDDILCFVAGITTVSPLFFIIMIFITRIISVTCSCFSFNNDLIPFDTWWGILLWILFFAITIFLTVIIYKKGEKIERFFKRKKKIK